MNPKLLAYKIDAKAWSEKMIALGTRDKQWDLVIEEIGPEIYRFPLFTEEFCQLVMEHAEKTGDWTKARHAFYPTTDILLEDIKLKDMYNWVLHEYCHPIARHIWGLEGTSWKRATSEDFIISIKTYGKRIISMVMVNIQCCLVSIFISCYEIFRCSSIP